MKQVAASLKDFIPGARRVLCRRAALDRDSEGLLVLTNDVAGVTQPQTHRKIYYAQVEGILMAAARCRRFVLASRSTMALPQFAGIEIVAEPDWLWPHPPIRERKEYSHQLAKSHLLCEGRNCRVRRNDSACRSSHSTINLCHGMGDYTLNGPLISTQWREIAQEKA